MNVKHHLDRLVSAKNQDRLRRVQTGMHLLGRIYKTKNLAAQAQALAYTTILSLVPIGAVFFSILGLITEKQGIKENIYEFISVYFFPEYVSGIFTQLESLASNSLALGAIALPALFAAGVFLYAKVDAAINKIWNTHHESRWFRNSMAFFMTLFFGPMILVLVFSIPPYLQTLPYYREVAKLALVSWLVPILTTTIGLYVLYFYIPATRVRHLPALGGAFAASLMIQSSNLLVSWYLKNFSKFDLLYGSLAFVPIFLLWVFLLWLIVLLGAAGSFLLQYRKESVTSEMLQSEQKLIQPIEALALLALLAQRFEDKGGSINLNRMNIMLSISVVRISQMLETLVEAGYVNILSHEKNEAACYQIGLHPSRIMVHELADLFAFAKPHPFFSSGINQAIHDLSVHPALLKPEATLQDFIERPESL